MVAEAQRFDSPEAYDRAAGESRSTTASEYSRIKGQLDRQGLDPSSAAYQSNLASLGLAEAASGAVNQNAARNSIKDRAWQRRTDALSLGKGLPINAMNGLSGAANGLNGIANANANRDERYAGAIGSSINNFMNSPGLNDFWKNLGGSSSAPSDSGWVSGYDL